MVHSRPFLFVAFAFAVMADPVSSDAYAIEAALRALDGRLDMLLPTPLPPGRRSATPGDSRRWAP